MKIDFREHFDEMIDFPLRLDLLMPPRVGEIFCIGRQPYKVKKVAYIYDPWDPKLPESGKTSAIVIIEIIYNKKLSKLVK